MKKRIIVPLLVLLLLSFPAGAGIALGQEACPFIDQGDVAVILADGFGLVKGSVTDEKAIAALVAVGIYPGALPDILPPSETEGWVSGWPVTNDLFCEQLIYLVWASAANGLLNADPGEAAGFVTSLALECGIVCPGPPPEEVIILPPPPLPSPTIDPQ